jgi:hypothetical protein
MQASAIGVRCLVDKSIGSRTAPVDRFKIILVAIGWWLLVIGYRIFWGRKSGLENQTQEFHSRKNIQ